MEDMCRTCLRTAINLSPLDENPTLINKIEAISSIRIETTDRLPSGICEECIANVNNMYNFRTVIRNNDKDLKERLATTSHLQDHVGDEKMLIEDHVIEERLKDTLVHSKQWKCKICCRSYTSRFKLYNHRRQIHVARGVCNICGVIVRSDNLKRHVQLHSEAPVVCKHCGKSFKNPESLRGHMQVHKGMIFTCEMCGKQSKVKAEHKRHMKIHADPEILKVPCGICGKKVRDLKRHMQSHTGERPYFCQYCDRGFTSTYALKVHTRQHTNEKPYMCDFCPMAFPQKVSLTTHLKSKHSKKF